MVNIEYLTNREKQLLDLAGNGFTDRKTAEVLGISVNTVSTYWKRLYNRMGVETRAQAVAQYIRHEQSSGAMPVSTKVQVPVANHCVSRQVRVEIVSATSLELPATRAEWREWINMPLHQILGVSSQLACQMDSATQFENIELIQLSAELLRMRLSTLIECMPLPSESAEHVHLPAPAGCI